MWRRVATQTRPRLQTHEREKLRLASCKARIAELCRRSPASPYSPPASVNHVERKSRAPVRPINETVGGIKGAGGSADGKPFVPRAQRGSLRKAQVRTTPLIPPDFAVPGLYRRFFTGPSRPDVSRASAYKKRTTRDSRATNASMCRVPPKTTLAKSATQREHHIG